MPTLPINLNTNVQDALQTRAEVILAAQNAGHAVTAAEIMMNPDTGLLRVELKTADNLSQNVIDTINANNGAAKVGPVLPDGFFALNLENMSLASVILKSAVSPSPDQQRIRFRMRVEDRNGARQDMGRLEGDGATNTYFDLGVNAQPSIQIIGELLITSGDKTGPLTLPVDDLTLTFDGAQTHKFPQTTSASLPAASAGAGDLERVHYFIDAAGLRYVNFRNAIRNGVVITDVPLRSYADSVAAGPE